MKIPFVNIIINVLSIYFVTCKLYHSVNYNTVLEHFKNLEKNDTLKHLNYTVEIIKASDQKLCNNDYCYTPIISFGNTKSNLPGILLVGGIHGNEPIGTDICYQFVTHVLEELEYNNTYYQWLVNTRIITIIPFSNAVGYYFNSRAELNKDPNRDFDIHNKNAWTTYASKILREKLLSNYYVAGITFHGGMRSLSYPWGIDINSTAEVPDKQLLQQLAVNLQAAAGFCEPNSIECNIDGMLQYPDLNNSIAYYYPIGMTKDIVYPITGTFEDWAYSGILNKTYNHSISKSNITDNFVNDLNETYNEHLKVVMFLAETDKNKHVNDILLGKSEDIKSIKLNSGIIPRNIRMALTLVEYAFPFVLVGIVNQTIIENEKNNNNDIQIKFDQTEYVTKEEFSNLLYYTHNWINIDNNMERYNIIKNSSLFYRSKYLYKNDNKFVIRDKDVTKLNESMKIKLPIILPNKNSRIIEVILFGIGCNKFNVQSVIINNREIDFRNNQLQFGCTNYITQNHDDLLPGYKLLIEGAFDRLSVIEIITSFDSHLITNNAYIPYSHLAKFRFKENNNHQSIAYSKIYPQSLTTINDVHIENETRDYSLTSVKNINNNYILTTTLLIRDNDSNLVLVPIKFDCKGDHYVVKKLECEIICPMLKSALLYINSLASLYRKINKIEQKYFYPEQLYINMTITVKPIPHSDNSITIEEFSKKNIKPLYCNEKFNILYLDDITDMLDKFKLTTDSNINKYLLSIVLKSSDIYGSANAIVDLNAIKTLNKKDSELVDEVDTTYASDDDLNIKKSFVYIKTLTCNFTHKQLLIGSITAKDDNIIINSYESMHIDKLVVIHKNNKNELTDGDDILLYISKKAESALGKNTNQIIIYDFKELLSNHANKINLSDIYTNSIEYTFNFNFDTTSNYTEQFKSSNSNDDMATIILKCTLYKPYENNIVKLDDTSISI